MHRTYARTSTEGALPPSANMNRYETFTYKLKSFGRDFDKNMPHALQDRIDKQEFVGVVEKVNTMMERRPAEVEGYALECRRQKKKWLTAAIVADLALLAFFILFVLSFAAFWTFLGIAVDDVFDYWYPMVIAGAVWVISCFMMTVLTTLAIVCHQKHKKWSKMARDEEVLQKYHAIVRYLRRENERTFSHKGISWDLSIMQPEQHTHGWTQFHHPTLDVMLYHIPQQQQAHSQMRPVSVARPAAHESQRYVAQSRPVSVVRSAAPREAVVERKATVVQSAPKPKEEKDLGTSSNQKNHQHGAVVQPVIREEIEVNQHKASE